MHCERQNRSVGANGDTVKSYGGRDTSEDILGNGNMRSK